MKVSGMRAVLGVRAAMEAAGLGRTSRLNGGEVAGWIEANRYGSTGFSVAPSGTDGTRWHVVVSGRPHLRYVTFHDRDGTELTEPDDPAKLCPRVRRVFETLGLAVRDVRATGWQTMWDDDVDFEVETDRPEWLSSHDPTNADALRGEGPVLAMVGLSGAATEGAIESRAVLAAYVANGGTLLTRESLERLAADVAEANERRTRHRSSLRGMAPPPLRTGLVRLVGDRLLWQASGETTRWERDPVTITNHWGDEVHAWPVPARRTVARFPLKADVDFVVGGETLRELPFETWDAQFGHDAPWSRPEEPNPTP